MKIIRWVFRQIQFIRFYLNHPDVPVVWPLNVGTYYSQDGQDVYISTLLFKYLLSEEDQYIVDIGCNDPEKFSNSKVFETHFNCKTIAIDPIIEYAERWSNDRPGAIFIPTALGRSDGNVTLNIPFKSSNYDDMFSSIAIDSKKIKDTKCLQREVPCTRLSVILDNYNSNNVVIMSIDVEGFELEVLEGIDFERINIKCLIVENNTNCIFGTEEIRNYLRDKGFVFFSRIGYLDDVFIHCSIVDNLYRPRSLAKRVASLFNDSSDKLNSIS